MPEGQILEFSGLTKRFGSVTAVERVSARVEPGVVTGFLGPNGAGKTTTLRILLGLVRPSAGTATIGGVPYAELRHPLRTVGAALEASSFHPARTAHNHLRIMAQAARLPLSRIDESLAMVGLETVADRKVGGFSLGMRQRLGLAGALLGDPGVLVLDEPVNGLDPEGIKWIRGLLRALAAEGRTVLLSSHLLAEVQQTVDSVLIISQGRLVYQGGLDELSRSEQTVVVADSPDRSALAAAFAAARLEYDALRSGLVVRGREPEELGRIALAAGVPLSSLARRGGGLEEIFLDLVSGVRTHPSAEAVGVAAAAAPAVSAPEADAAEPGASSVDEDEVEAEIEAEAESTAQAEADADTAAETEAQSVPAATAGSEAGEAWAVAAEAAAPQADAGTGREAAPVTQHAASADDDLNEDDDTDAAAATARWAAAPPRSAFSGPTFDSLLLGPPPPGDAASADDTAHADDEEGGAAR
ncbi:MAG TPA: ABC transporter ATP-binding protein [Microbacteriaceae bacterium]|jgi:ABC-2 type transport system ATP-binding protein|nr:ABC transporter ATP-binding protein [Microbacteriaceae bacterium]HPZ34691.1 ABC transporter ATP-binding protein [Microbacteriaceae bacterium]HQC92523.1 ABC transporter ATP-binding protein [Microbacteriaceae bacterium]